MSHQRNGVDMAISLLAALAHRGGACSSAVLARELGIPRTSFYRLSRSLERFGLVRCQRGSIAVGPLARQMISVIREGSEAADRRRAKLFEESKVRPSSDDIPVAPPAFSMPTILRKRRRFRIGFANAGLINPWQIALVHSVEHAAARHYEELEWVKITDAQYSESKQIEDIRELAASGADGILVSAVSPRRLVPVTGELAARGIPVVMVERGGVPGMVYTSFVTSNNNVVSHTTAKWLAERIRRPGLVLMIFGHEDLALAQSRVASAQSIFAQYPQVQPIISDTTDFRRENAYSVAKDAIERYGSDIVGVWCDSGLNSVGSIQAFLDAGFERGRIPPHTGGEINLSYKLALAHHIPLAGMDYPPAMGFRGFEILLTALSGRAVPQYLEVPLRFIATRHPGASQIRPSMWADEHARWDMPDTLIFGTGLGPAYDPGAFRVAYPGNLHNRSAASEVSRPW